MGDQDLTALLRRFSKGDKEAEAELFPYIYRELRRIAMACLRGERPEHTLQATALVNEAYMKLIGGQTIEWQNRGHFFSLAARSMRNVLVDYARHRAAAKRAGIRVQIEEGLMLSPEACTEIDELNEALNRLAEFAPRAAKVVEMRYFAGLTEEEIAQVLECSSKTVKRDWKMAAGWLRDELSSSASA